MNDDDASRLHVLYQICYINVYAWAGLGVKRNATSGHTY